jgi:hypothetical protein
MGFNLENEIQSALKPLLAKAKNTNTETIQGSIGFSIRLKPKMN